MCLQAYRVGVDGMLMEVTQSLIPVVMAGIIAVYSLVIAVLIASAITPDKKYSLFKYAGAIMTTSEERWH